MYNFLQKSKDLWDSLGFSQATGPRRRAKRKSQSAEMLLSIFKMTNVISINC